VSIVEQPTQVAPQPVKLSRREPVELPQPAPQHTPIPLVKLCYTMVHAADAVGIHDLADGEYLPTDTTLEQESLHKQSGSFNNELR
jgi:hypothetical protein